MKEGIFAVNKPVGKSSFDVIRELKKKNPGKKIGHGGTLDPLAEGVLVVGIGRAAAKQLSTILKGTDKEYVAEFILGKTSETHDAESEIIEGSSPQEPSQTEIENALKKFKGDIQQVPPRYSAVKVQGQPAYKRARRGETFTLDPKDVHIKEIEIVSYNYPHLQLRIVSGSGVYIRSLARDLGKELGTGAYMSALTRTRVGNYTI